MGIKIVIKPVESIKDLKPNIVTEVPKGKKYKRYKVKKDK